MSDDTSLDDLAQALMRRVRDAAIAECDRLVAAAAVGPTAERWTAVVTDDRIRRAVSELIPDIVDQTLFELLDRADNDELDLAWRRADGSYVLLEELGMGELGGWLLGPGPSGWRARYSRARYFDPFEGLELDD